MATNDTTNAQDNQNAPARTFTEAEVNERIEGVRREEKQKLYSEIESLKRWLADADLTKQERDALKAKLSEAESSIAAINAAKKDGVIDPLLLAKQVAEDTRKVVSSEFGNRLSDMETKLTAANERARKQELNSFKQSLIAAANGRIIPAMVVGNTEEELTAAAEESKRQYEAIASSTNQNSGVANVTPPPAINPRAANGGNGTPPETGIDSFTRSGDPATFSQNRKQTLAALKKRFG